MAPSQALWAPPTTSHPTLGQAVFDLFDSHQFQPTDHPPTMPQVDAAFSTIADARGAAAKGAALRTLLERCDPLCAKSVVKVLSGDLRIGLREGHLEAAIGTAFEQQLTDVQTRRHAHRRSGPYRGAGTGRQARRRQSWSCSGR